MPVDKNFDATNPNNVLCTPTYDATGVMGGGLLREGRYHGPITDIRPSPSEYGLSLALTVQIGGSDIYFYANVPGTERAGTKSGLLQVNARKWNVLLAAVGPITEEQAQSFGMSGEPLMVGHFLGKAIDVYYLPPIGKKSEGGVGQEVTVLLPSDAPKYATPDEVAAGGHGKQVVARYAKAPAGRAAPSGAAFGGGAPQFGAAPAAPVAPAAAPVASPFGAPVASPASPASPATQPVASPFGGGGVAAFVGGIGGQ